MRGWKFNLPGIISLGASAWQFVRPKSLYDLLAIPDAFKAFRVPVANMDVGDLFGLAFLVVGVLLLWTGNREWLRARFAFGMVPLPDAVRRAYEETQESALTRFQDRWDPNPADRLRRVADAIGSADLLYGRQLPASGIRKMPQDDYLSGRVEPDLATFRFTGEKFDRWTELRVRSNDLSEFIKAMKKKSGEGL